MPRIELVAPEQGQPFHLDMGSVTEGPTMPVIELRASVAPALEGIQYRFQVGDPQTGRALEYEDAPASDYNHPAVIDSGWVANPAWTIDFGGNLYGGHVTCVTVSIRVGNRELCSRTFARDFWILGGALPSDLRNSYIDSRTQYSTTIQAMARKIAYRESLGTHYMSPQELPGATFHERYPLRSIDGGYGVMQLTDPDALRINTIWNWKANIDRGMQIINASYNLGVSYLGGLSIPGGATDAQKLLEGYNRWNGGPDDRYHWWSTGPDEHNGVPEGLRKFGYIATDPAPRSTKGYRDYNEDGISDEEENPYNIPLGPRGPNVDAKRAARYADSILYHGQGGP